MFDIVTRPQKESGGKEAVYFVLQQFLGPILPAIIAYIAYLPGEGARRAKAGSNYESLGGTEIAEIVLLPLVLGWLSGWIVSRINHRRARLGRFVWILPVVVFVNELMGLSRMIGLRESLKERVDEAGSIMMVAAAIGYSIGVLIGARGKQRRGTPKEKGGSV
jgi:hypothetical protein